MFGLACVAAIGAVPALADPVTFTDMTGRAITLEKPAERVIVFPVPWASTVIALDGGVDKLIAMHPESKLAMEGILGQFFPAAHDIPSDIIAGGGSKGFTPNVEAVAAMKPDLVIQWGNRKDDGVTPLANAGINTAAIVYGPEENARQIMTLVATAMGHADKLGRLMKWRDDTAEVLKDELAGLADADDRDAAAEALAPVGLSALAGQRFDLLSGGERQLVLLARALATGADVLILDEPASALDLRNQDRFLSVIDALRADGRHIIVFTTHLPQHASAVADDALMLYGPEDQIFGAVRKVLTEANLGRLYGIPVRMVEVKATAGGRMVSGVIPVFGAAVPA